MTDGTGWNLVRRARRGEPEALEAIVRAHYDPVWRTLWRFTRERASTDDLCQETFLKAIEGLGSFRGEASLRSWITRVGINLALNDRRRRRPLPVESLEGEATGGAGLEESERSRVLHEAVDGLPPDLRATVLLTVFSGWSQREAAEVLDCAEGTVAWRMHEAKRLLGEALPDGL